MEKDNIQLDWGKLKASVAYIIGRCDNASLGAVKLHKVLYYSDMLMYLAAGKPITGSTYRRRPYGPTCDPLLGVLAELKNEGIIDIEDVDYYGFLKKEYSILKDVGDNRLSKAEAAALDEIIDFVCNNNTAKTISEFSHDLVWEMVGYGEIIKYHNAIHLLPVAPSDEAMAWAESEIEKLESSRPQSKESDLGGIDSNTFRKRMAEVHP